MPLTCHALCIVAEVEAIATVFSNTRIATIQRRCQVVRLVNAQEIKVEVKFPPQGASPQGKTAKRRWCAVQVDKGDMLSTIRLEKSDVWRSVF